VFAYEYVFLNNTIIIIDNEHENDPDDDGSTCSVVKQMIKAN